MWPLPVVERIQPTCRSRPGPARISQDIIPEGRFMKSRVNVNPISEHELYLKLFITNGGGW